MEIQTKGMLFGLAGVICFAFTLPLTRVAVVSLNPVDVTILRIFLAGVAAAVLLQINGRSLINLRLTAPTIPVTVGVVIGFPLFSALAMRTESAGAGGVVLAVLPLFTAIASAIWMRQRLPLLFWFLAVVGGLLVGAFVSDGGTIETIGGLLLLLLASAFAALGYAAGVNAGQLMPAWEVICRALVLALPVSTAAMMFIDYSAVYVLSSEVLAAMLYLALVSQLSGFFLWYRGLALGGVPLVSQIQLLQPIFTLFIAQAMLSEPVGVRAYVYAFFILMVIVLARKVLSKPT